MYKDLLLSLYGYIYNMYVYEDLLASYLLSVNLIRYCLS